jgi:biofilm PGA synthesis N-glycosyltransferase PgaC
MIWLQISGDALLFFIALYPIITGAYWVAGGLIFHYSDERYPPPDRPAELPGVTILIPAHNEEAVIAESVRAALAVDYPVLEVIVLDDGSTDATSEHARAGGDGDPRLRVLRDDENKGKAEQLNRGFREAGHPLVLTIDADAQLHPASVEMLVRRIEGSANTAAVAGDPRVTNRGGVLAGLQTLEFSSVIGLIRRTQAVRATVGTVAGIIGMYRRDAVLAVGGFNPAMATEDIELTYRLLLAGWETGYEPRALIGMQVPTSVNVLWKQRRRWARGQGEVIHAHVGELVRWKNRRLWPVASEAVLSALWAELWLIAIVYGLVVGLTSLTIGIDDAIPIWGVAVGVVAMIQVFVALLLDYHYDRSAMLTLAFGPIYPMGYWVLNAMSAVFAEIPSLMRGAKDKRVVWETSRTALPPQPDA